VQKLFTTSEYGNHHVDLIQIVASIAGVNLEVTVVAKTSAEEKDLFAKAAVTTLPILEVEENVFIATAPAIASFVAASSESSAYLAGTTAFEQSSVDQWVNFLRVETGSLAGALNAIHFGHISDVDANEHAFIVALLKENLKALNNGLKGREWIAGTDKPSIADYQLAIVELEL